MPFALRGRMTPSGVESDAITEADYARRKRPNLSRFIYELGDRRLIDDAIGTIEERHPAQTIWVEAAPSTLRERETGSPDAYMESTSDA